jgi:hypothetical protein
VDADGQQVFTPTYDVQCLKSDAKMLIALLAETYGNDSSSFVFHKTRHTNPTEYHGAICNQHKYLASKRVIPIQGISMELMSTLHLDLLEITGIQDIHVHKQTHSHGRWSIMTTVEYFQSATQQVKEMLSLLDDYADNHMDDSNFPPRGLAFKNRRSIPRVLNTTILHQAPSKNQFQPPLPPTVLSSAPSTLSHNQNRPSSNLPHNFRISHWDPPPGTPSIPFDPTATSPMPLLHYPSDNSYLRRHLAELADQVQLLLVQMEQIRRVVAGGLQDH